MKKKTTSDINIKTLTAPRRKLPNSRFGNGLYTQDALVDRLLEEIAACVVLSGGKRPRRKELAGMTVGKMLAYVLPNGVDLSPRVTSPPKLRRKNTD
jgi:hypothetical protein